MTDGPDINVKVHCYCLQCGWDEIVDESEGGQTLGGTAGMQAARHQATCNGKIKYNWIATDAEGTLIKSGVERPSDCPHTRRTADVCHDCLVGGGTA